MSKVRFVDSSIRVNSGGGEGGGSSISASYALSSSHSDFATSASYAEYAVSASHEIVKEVSSSYADTASLAQSGNGPFTGSFTGSFFGNGAGVFSGSFSGSIPDAFQIISGSVSASISPDNGLKINSPVDITMPSGSVFTIHEPDIDQQNRLNFKFDQGNPILEIASRTTTSSLHLKTNQTGNGLLLNSNGFIKYISGATTYGVQFTTEFKPIDTTGAIPLGFYNRRWADLYLFNGKKISFSTNASPYPDLVSFRHTAGTNTLVMSGSSDVSLDVKGVVSASRFTVSSSADTTPGYTFWNNSTTGMLSNSPTNLKFQVDGTSSPELELNTGQAIFRTPVSFTDNEISSVSKIRNLGSISASGDFSSSITSTASFGTYLGDGSQLTGIEAGTNLTQSIFVTQNGDDTTGTIGNISKPFATLESASQAATTGSTIFVYPGLYTVEANFNLAKPGVDYYFYPNTTVSKSTAGDMFDISGFTDTGMNVWGHADFILGSSAGSLMNSINIAGPTFDYTFQARDITSDSSTSIVDYFAPDDHSINWEFRNMSSSAGACFGQSNVYSDGLVNITCDEIISYGSCISTGNGFKAGQIRAHKFTSTNDFAITWYAGSRLTLIVDEAVGVGGDASSLAYRFTSGGNINIIGNTSGIQMGLNGGGNPYTGVCNQTGKCTHLAVEGMTGTYNGSNVAYVVMDGTGKLNINFVNTGATGVNGYIKQSNGTINANIVNNQGYSSEITITGGTFIGDGKFQSTFPYRDISVSGGTFIWKGIYDAYVGSTNYGSQRHVIDQTGGTVRLEGTINLDGANFTTALPSKIVRYNGGKLILDGATLTTVDTTQPTPAIYPDQNRDVHIFSGGVNYNQTGSNALLLASGSGYSLTNVLGGMIIEDSSVE